jgi:hypothetical protein
MSSELSAFQNGLLGTIGSTIEVFIQHPLNIVKNCHQTNKKINFSFSYLYRGLWINGLSMGFITGSQFATFGYLSNKNKNNDIFNSYFSGVLSSLISSPVEFSILQKQKLSFMNYSSFKILNNIYKNKGIKGIYRGLLFTSIREGIYTSGMLFITPYIERKVFEDINLTSSFISSIIAGLISGIASQPFDTIKTIYQYKSDDVIFYPRDYRFYFSGLTPRLIRIIGTFFIINQSNNFFKDKI